MIDYRTQLRRAVEALVVTSPTGFSWFGVRSAILPARLGRVISPELRRMSLERAVAARLYEDFYLSGGPRPDLDRAGPRTLRGTTTDLTAALSAANTGRACWDRGWELRADHDHALVVHKDGLTLRVRPEDYKRDAGSVRLPTEMLGISPGFYTVLGENPLSDEGTVRLYWNLTPPIAPAFVRMSTSTLNAARVPFALKVLNDPARFTRCDAAVVYVEGRRFDAAAELLTAVYGSLRAQLRATVPALTKTLGPGLACAETPHAGSSFGQHRCDLIAEALVEAHDHGARSVDERMAFVEQGFSRAGLTLEAPFLNPGSRDRYSWTL